MESKSANRWSLKSKIGIVVVALVVLPPLFVPLISPWSEINCKHEYINLKTGHGRRERRLWYVLISEQVFDTSLSRASKGGPDDLPSVNQWRIVNTFSPWQGNSPHYRFHAALHQTRRLEEIWGLLNEVTPEKKREHANEVLNLWRTTERTGTAEDYLDSLLEDFP
jgi:hypothetical protein